jgi:Ca-activated chloride channel family protein
MISYFKSLTFAQPYWLLLMLIIPALIAYYWWKNKHQFASLQLSGVDWVKSVQPNFKTRFRALPFALRMIALALLIIVMARPQTSNRQKQVHIEGIDIMLAIDISGSMRARDLRPDRLEAAKEVAVNFIKSRSNDRIGLVVFSGEAFTQCPLTTDHTVLIDLFKPIKSGIIEDGTAIGDGLATAVNRIKDSEAISRVIILLTDGVQNMGSIDPITAAEIAKSFGIRVYTIGVGTHGTAPMPVTTPFGEQMMDVEVKIDEPILKKVAQITDGQYFRATDKSSLNKVYAKIDALEKSKIDVNIFQNKTEEFIHFAIAALLLLLADLILRFTIFRIKP